MNNRNNNYNNNPGCLTGLLQLFLLKTIYDWGQSNFGAKHGGCCGCIFGLVLFMIAAAFFMQIVFHTDWFRFGF